MEWALNCAKWIDTCRDEGGREMVELGALRVRARGMRIHALMLKSKWISCFENYLWIKTFDFPTEIGLSFLERSQADAEFRSWNVHCILVARRCVVDWNATRKWNEVRFGYQCHGNIYRFSKLEKAHFHGLILSLSQCHAHRIKIKKLII